MIKFVAVIAFALIVYVAFNLIFVRKKTDVPTQRPDKSSLVRNLLGYLRFVQAWVRWILGIVFIYLSACLAIASVFLGWVDISFIFWHIGSRTGTAIGITIFLGIWLYPVLMVYMRKPINKKWGRRPAMLAVLVAIAFMFYVQSKSGFLIHTASGIGASMFWVASILLYLGVILYKPIKPIILSKSATLCLPDSPCPGDARVTNVMGRGRRLYSFCGDDKQMHVISQLYHAIGQAKFMLEPAMELGQNFGLAPWALCEAEYLVRHHENDIRDTWNKYFPSQSVDDPKGNSSVLRSESDSGRKKMFSKLKWKWLRLS